MTGERRPFTRVSTLNRSRLRRVTLTTVIPFCIIETVFLHNIGARFAKVQKSSGCHNSLCMYLSKREVLSHSSFFYNYFAFGYIENILLKHHFFKQVDDSFGNGFSDPKVKVIGSLAKLAPAYNCTLRC